MLYKLAICDDEIQIQFLLEEQLKQIFKDNELQVEIDCFGSGEKFCEEFYKGKYHLIFLDIEYEGMNGVEIGRFIRDKAGDEVVQIAYISGNTGYAMELFEYRPINFLIKPVVKKEIIKIVDKFLLLNDQQSEYFQFRVGNETFQISLSEILSFTSSGRKIIINMAEGKKEFYGNLEKIYQQLKKKDFLYVHKSYLINSHFVKRKGYDSVTLTNGDEIPISQSRRSVIRQQFLNFKKEEM